MRSTVSERVGLALLAVLRVGVEAGRYLGEPERYRNGEEAYNASVGWIVRAGGLWDQLLVFQYKEFCGGCTVHALTAAAFGIERELAWRCVALAWGLATMLVGFVAMDRHLGRGPAWAFAGLWALPAPGLADLGLLSWGNHEESALFVLGALALLDRPIGAALVLGLGTWFCRTTAYADVVLLPILAWRRPVALVAFGAGLLPILAPAAAGDRGDYVAHLSLEPAYVWTRLKPLLVPERLGAYLYPRGAPGLAAVELGAALVGVAAVWRRPILPFLALAFAAGWVLSGFKIPRILDDMGVLQLRYHAPWMLILTLLVAASTRWRAGWLVVGAVMAAHLWGLAGGMRPPRWEALEQRVIDEGGLVGVAGRRMDPARLAGAHSADVAAEGVLRRLEAKARGGE